jgi:hypothetical protein
MKTYGNLYRKLITTTGEIPIGLYRTNFYAKTQHNRETVKQKLIIINKNKKKIN